MELRAVGSAPQGWGIRSESGCELDKFCDSCATVGKLATEGGTIPKEGKQGPEEVAERPSEAFNGGRATAQFSEA